MGERKRGEEEGEERRGRKRGNGRGGTGERVAMISLKSGYMCRTKHFLDSPRRRNTRCEEMTRGMPQG